MRACIYDPEISRSNANVCQGEFSKTLMEKETKLTMESVIVNVGVHILVAYLSLVSRWFVLFLYACHCLSFYIHCPRTFFSSRPASSFPHRSFTLAAEPSLVSQPLQWATVAWKLSAAKPVYQLPMHTWRMAFNPNCAFAFSPGNASAMNAIDFKNLHVCAKF